jgi:hypothetical protein
MDATIQECGNGAISIIHKKFKNLIIPAGLGLYDMDSHKHSYDVNNYNEPVHNSLYDKLLELASFKGNDGDEAVSHDEERKKKKEDKEKPLQIQPVMTKRHKIKLNKTKKRKHVKA